MPCFKSGLAFGRNVPVSVESGTVPSGIMVDLLFDWKGQNSCFVYM